MSSLKDAKLQELISLIKNNFRVRQNQAPLYIDIGHNRERISAPQHQIIFGRRGSGKSCLMINYLNNAKKGGVVPIYLLADVYKKLTYPDILIRLLIEITETINNSCPWRIRIFRGNRKLAKSIKELRKLLDKADEADIEEQEGKARDEAADVEINGGSASARLRSGTSTTRGKVSKFREQKLDTIERHLQDYKKSLIEVLHKSKVVQSCVLLDDFYLIPREYQPDVLDYLHRLLRDTPIYLKVATIRHRTSLSRNHPHTIGVELSQDVEEINLDKTLEDYEATKQYLLQMLTLLAEKVELTNIIDKYFNPEAASALTLASGGVPRDFLMIFVLAVDASVEAGNERWLTPTAINKGARRLMYDTKLKNLREDVGEIAINLEQVFNDLYRFCVIEKRKTAFLVSKDESQINLEGHNIIQQLMDAKLIHVIEPDTSAASSRPGRFEAYTLDTALFMEPRRRGLELVEFWKRGDDHHKTGVREAPVYSLDRACNAFISSSRVEIESYIAKTEQEQ